MQPKEEDTTDAITGIIIVINNVVIAVGQPSLDPVNW